MPDLTLGLAIDAASGLTMIALGFFVASLKPRSAATTALAVFCVSFGAGFAVSNALEPSTFFVSSGPAATALFLVSALAIIALGLQFPTPASRRERSAIAWAGVLFAAFVAACIGRALLDADISLPFFTSLGLTAGSLVFTIGLLALRYHAAPPEALRLRRQCLLVCAALVIFPAFTTGLGATARVLAGVNGAPLDRAFAYWILVQGAGLAVLTALWLRNAGTGTRDERRAARTLAMLIPALVLAGVAATPFLGADPPDSGANGLSRVLGVAVFAYAILREQLLDIDLKVKWTISRGTVAAIFLAVFFVVGQLAQNFLNEQLGLLAGGVAAGLLLFGIAPLQRFAERVADTAMPNTRAPGEMTGDERLAVYRRAIALAWADGKLTPKERRLLKGLREELRLTAEEAERLEHATLPSAPPTVE